MLLSDYLSLIGLLFSIVLGLYNMNSLTKKSKLDSVTSRDIEYDLYTKYSNKVKELEEEITSLKLLIEGNLHLLIDVPLKPILLEGVSQVTTKITHIKDLA